MDLARTLRSWLEHPAARGLDLDSAQASAVHAELIRAKPFLNRLMRGYYEDLARIAAGAPDGLRLEIGAGGGFLGELVPGLVTLDLRPGADVTVRASALELPLADDSVGAILALNVLHHLADPVRFFAEAQRVLRPGGVIGLIEPFVSPFSVRLYRRLHHEPFDARARRWALPPGGPMSQANGAMPWNILVRDRAVFEARFGQLEIARVAPHTFVSYLLSGGVSMRALAPAASFGVVRALERALGPAMTSLGTLMTVEIRRR